MIIIRNLKKISSKIESDVILSTISNLLMNFFERLFNNLFKLSKIFATIVIVIAIIATNSCSYLL